MANRSDRNSAFPRKDKRVWLMTCVTEDLNPHKAGELKALMIDAHKHHRIVVKQREKMSVRDVSGGEE